MGACPRDGQGDWEGGRHDVVRTLLGRSKAGKMLQKSVCLVQDVGRNDGVDGGLL